MTNHLPRGRVISVYDVGQFDDHATKFELPETLPATTGELDALLDAARESINGIRSKHASGEGLTDADADELEKLLGDVDTITAERGKVATAEAEHVEKINGLLSRADAATAAPSTEAAPETEAEPEAEAETEGAESEQRELVTAGAPATTGAGRQTRFTGPGAPSQFPAGSESSGSTPGWKMHPGAPGYQAGMGKVGFGGIADSLEKIRPGSRSSIRPNRPNRTLDGQEFARQVVATLDREVKAVEDSHELYKTIVAAVQIGNLTAPTFDSQGSLTAAGGWCAPSEQLYDFCDVPDATDLISLPEITINRGGIRWPREPDLSGIFEDFEWFFTETQLEALDGNGKPTAIKTCVEIPCADQFDEIRLNAVGWCVESGILQEQGWPELSEWFMRNLTQEHLRALSRRTILDMVAGSGSAKVIPPTSIMGSVASVLNSLAIMATNLRLKRGLSRTAKIEGVAPSWFHEVLRADLAFREGIDVFAVTDAQINGWLSARNIVLQYVGDWQTRAAGLPGHLDTLQWPGTVDVLMYPAGTWFRSMSQVIELGVMYPKEQLQVNRFTRMFTEDAIAVGKRCGESILVRIPLETNGAIGARKSITLADPGDRNATVTVDAISGTWKAKFSANPAVETAALAENISAASLKTALAGLDDGHAASEFTVTGSNGGPFAVTHPAELGTLNASSIDLAGGTGVSVQQS